MYTINFSSISFKLFTALAIIALFLAGMPVPPAYADVGVVSQWATATVINTNIATSPRTGVTTVAAGNNRLFVVAVTLEYTTITPHNVSATYGGQTLTPITENTAQRQTVWVGYLNEAGITSATNTTLSVAFNTTNMTRLVVHTATYSGVDQSNPIVASASASGLSVSSLSFSSVATVDTGYIFYVTNCNDDSGTNPATPPAGYTEHFDTNYSLSLTKTVASKATTGASESDTVTFARNDRAALAVVSVRPLTLTVSPATLPDGTIGSAYNQSISASGGTAAYSFVVSGGALPAGLTLASDGTLSGTPTAGGTFNFTVTATDSSAAPGPYKGSQAYTLVINAPTITVSPATLPSGAVTFPYNQTITASGGIAPYSFVVSSGALPDGLTLASNGTLSGTPTQAGTFNFTVTAQDSSTGTGPFSGSRAYTVNIDNGTTVTVDQATGQLDPTKISPINFRAVFSSPVTGFDFNDVTLGGTAGPSSAVVTEISPNNGTTYNVAVSGMTSDGTVIISIPAGAALDSSNRATLASTSTDNKVTYDTTSLTVMGSVPANGDVLTSGLTQLTVTFSEDVKSDGSAGAANNAANYLLVENGTDNSFNTLSCAGGLVADDTRIAINSATYTNNGGSGPFTATLTVSPLAAGTYRLFVCGTTSVEDLAGNKLNSGLLDTTVSFFITSQRVVNNGGGSSSTGNANLGLLPATGFPMNQVTALPVQPADKAYASTDIWLEIPRLGVKMSIVGVPFKDGNWDVKWLDKNAGWLNGSAYPTWDGNSVITGHVWDALNKPGPFAELKKLKYGDQIKIHAFGQVYVYEVRSSESIAPTKTSKAFKHEEKSWVTLLTCEEYKEGTQTYAYRRMVRAVLVSVTAEK